MGSPDTAFFVGAGIIAFPSQYPNPTAYYRNVQNISHLSVLMPVPGQVYIGQGTGQFVVNHSGVKGVIEAQVYASAPGAAHTVALLQNIDGSAYVMLGLDNANHPVAKVRVPGSFAADWSPSNTTNFAAGAPITMRFMWDTTGIVGPGVYGSFMVNGHIDGNGHWGTAPSARWTPSPYSVLQVGYGLGAADFNGMVTAVAVGS
jgi:hypothetical protein